MFIEVGEYTVFIGGRGLHSVHYGRRMQSSLE